MTEILVPLVISTNAVATGVFAGTLLGGVPLLLALPPDRYIHAHGFLATRYDPFMPLTLATTVVLDAALAGLVQDPAGRLLFGSAGAVLVSVMAVSLIKTVPINKWVVGLDPEALPEDWERRDPRPKWQRWNAVRSYLCAIGLAVNLAAAIVA
ncbi:anthrone oxygenase family protein [Streptomonospora algeriensis]|uniref:Anthrone oxygenase family protein n=1 Tax=Streptomonospora algeriensis TaxID=995084 RepID=A0ABW3BDC0_9ACTN